MANVKFINVTKRYGELVILDGINMEIKDREFVVIVGPSGCGKTTLLRMLAGLEEISEGGIYIDNKFVNQVHPSKREIAMVFQDYALYPHMTVAENMSFALRLKKMPQKEVKHRVSEAAGTLQLQKLLDRMPRQLSGGQRQRVAIGRAIVRKPKVFLFDEPLSNLDAKLREEMRVEIAKLHQRLTSTVIYVTHDQVEAMTLAGRIMVLNRGIVQQIGTPIEIYRKPVNLFVAGFIGSPTMNFINGKIEINGEDVYFKASGTAPQGPEQGASGGTAALRPQVSEAMPTTSSSVGRNATRPQVSPACAEASAGREAMPTTSFRIQIPSFLLPDAGAHKNKEIVLGIRPDDVRVGKFSDKNRDVIETVLEVSELLGHRENLYLKAQDIKILAIVEAFFNQSPGSAVPVSFNHENMHLFDKGNGSRISV
ncbi:MAG: sn-glycerol-3-phosphate ABC transporter ATP-binding protein UgpC [Elusimicrobia bacterium]|nr:sn-glycerol-3-phosphate ABC transporter ATP-binding protein UgpC [Elusimicrobiota bacterium]